MYLPQLKFPATSLLQFIKFNVVFRINQINRKTTYTDRDTNERLAKLIVEKNKKSKMNFFIYRQQHVQTQIYCNSAHRQINIWILIMNPCE